MVKARVNYSMTQNKQSIKTHTSYTRPSFVIVWATPIQTNLYWISAPICSMSGSRDINENYP